MEKRDLWENFLAHKKGHNEEPCEKILKYRNLKKILIASFRAQKWKLLVQMPYNDKHYDTMFHLRWYL